MANSPLLCRPLMKNAPSWDQLPKDEHACNWQSHYKNYKSQNNLKNVISKVRAFFTGDTVLILTELTRSVNKLDNQLFKLSSTQPHWYSVKASL